MKHILKNVIDTYGAYGLDYLDCFEHPTAILYKYIKPGSDNLYLIKSKMQSVYGTFSKVEELHDFSEETGVACIAKEINSDLVDCIKSLLQHEIPVLVPGNLITIYYSNFYREKDWSHLFLVNGYDDERELFYILDHTHLFDDTDRCEYCKFVIKWEDLCETFRQYNGYYKDKIYFMVHKKDEISRKCRQQILLKELVLNMEGKKNVEYSILDFLKHCYEEKGDFDVVEQMRCKDYILNIPKSKMVICKQVIQIMKEYLYDTSYMEQTLESLFQCWKRDNLGMVKRCMRKDSENVFRYNLSENTIQYEEKMVLELKRFIDFLENMKGKEEKENYNLICENNGDNLIRPESDGYLFKMDNGRIYNSWLADNCPKVILYNSDGSYPNKIRMQVKLTIREDCDAEGHQEGIFFRTDKNVLYTFALDYKKSFVFDMVGIGTVDCFDDIKNVEQDTGLTVEQKGNEITIGVLRENGDYITLGTYNKDLKIQQMGIFCKTYNMCKDLIVYFSKIEVEEGINTADT